MIISELKVDVVSESNHFQLVFKPQETVDQTMGTSLMNDNSKKLSTWDELLAVSYTHLTLPTTPYV